MEPIPSRILVGSLLLSHNGNSYFIFLNCIFSMCKMETQQHLLWGSLEFVMPISCTCHEAYGTKQTLRILVLVSIIPTKVPYAMDSSVDKGVKITHCLSTVLF